MDSALMSFLPEATRGLFAISLVLGLGSIYKGYSLYHAYKDRSSEHVARTTTSTSNSVPTILAASDLSPAHMDGVEHVKIVRYSTAASGDEQHFSVPVSRRKTSTDTRVPEDSSSG